MLVLTALVAPWGVQRAHAATTVERDIAYSGGSTGTHQTFDVWYTNSSSLRPAVILIHGGGWVGGDKAAMENSPVGVIPQLLGAGYVVINMNYRLAAVPASGPGETPAAYRDQPADTEAVIQWAKAHSASPYFIDANRIALVGGSAGGQIALLTALRDSGVPQNKVKAVVSWAGPTNMVLFGYEQACIRPGATGPCKTVDTTVGSSHVAYPYPEMVRQWAGGCTVLECRNQVYGPNSPVNHVSSQNPATLMIHGVADEIVPFEQSVELYSKQLALGNTLNTRLQPCAVTLDAKLCAEHFTLVNGVMPTTLQFLGNKL